MYLMSLPKLQFCIIEIHIFMLCGRYMVLVYVFCDYNQEMLLMAIMGM